MNIVLTGSLGNISKPLATSLVKDHHTVTIISSNQEKTPAIEELGAKAAIGSVSDAAFLAAAFTGADIVYTMVPPNFGAPDLRAYMRTTGQNYADAIKKSGVKKVVNLSSIGAHLDEGTGPIKGIHDEEIILNQLEDVAVKHIRAPFFFTNFFNDIPLIKYQGIIGANYPSNTRLVMVHPEDIASVIAKEMALPFEGKSVNYLVSDERTIKEIVEILGAAINRPDLPWVEFTDEQSYNGMRQAGLPEEISRNFTEMGSALRKGQLWEDFDLKTPTYRGKWRLEDFAKSFADKFNA